MSTIAEDQDQRLRRLLDEAGLAYKALLHTEDLTPLRLSAAVFVANKLDREPLWVNLIGPPSTGKTVTVTPFGNRPEAILTGPFTEASLLSGSPSGGEGDEGATGGILRNIGEHGILVVKDFTSIISENKDRMKKILAALREIYDGHWVRHLGSAGGQTLEWRGKIGLLGAVTPVIDSHYEIRVVMGERFLFYRMRAPENPKRIADTAQRQMSMFQENRDDYQSKVNALLDYIVELGEREAPEVSPGYQGKISSLAALVARARGVVKRDGHSRKLGKVHEVESPARLARQFNTLFGALQLIDVDQATAWSDVMQVGLHSMPVIRCEILELLTTSDSGSATTAIAEGVGRAGRVVRRCLEDMEALQLVERERGSGRNPDKWRLTTETHQWLTGAKEPISLPTRVARRAFVSDLGARDRLGYRIDSGNHRPRSRPRRRSSVLQGPRYKRIPYRRRSTGRISGAR